MRESLGGWASRGSQLERRIIWRDIAQAPRDGRMIEVVVWGVRGWPKRTRWVNGQWEGGYEPTHWRTVQKTGKQWQGR